MKQIINQISFDKSFDNHLFDVCKDIQNIQNQIISFLDETINFDNFKVNVKPLLKKLCIFVIYLLILKVNPKTTLQTIEDDKNPLFLTLIRTEIEQYIEVLLDKLTDNIFLDAKEKINPTSIIDSSTIQKLNDDFIQLGGYDYYKAKYLKYKQKYLQLKLIKNHN
jgi:hypothetical protein